MQRLSSLLLVLLLALAYSSVAQAEIRTATVPDPADATPTVSGVPNNPDIRLVKVVYDSAGSLIMEVDFYHGMSDFDTSENYAFWSEFDVTSAAVPTAGVESPGCSSAVQQGNLSGQHHVWAATSTAFLNRASVYGYSGYLPLTRASSADESHIVLTANSPVLANRDYRCLRYSLHARVHASISNPYSSYDASCDCWYVNSTLDWIGNFKENSYLYGVWFDGLQLQAPPPPPPPKKKAQIRGRAQRQGCRTIRLTSWDVGPALAGGSLNPANGQVVARLGRQIKRFPATRTRPVVFRRVRSGTRRVVISYLGDEWREPSDTRTLNVRLPYCWMIHR